MIAAFSLERASKSGAVFDEEKTPLDQRHLYPELCDA